MEDKYRSITRQLTKHVIHHCEEMVLPVTRKTAWTWGQINPNAALKTSLLLLKDSCKHTLWTSVCSHPVSLRKGESRNKGGRGGHRGEKRDNVSCFPFFYFFFILLVQVFSVYVCNNCRTTVLSFKKFHHYMFFLTAPVSAASPLFFSAVVSCRLLSHSLVGAAVNHLCTVSPRQTGWSKRPCPFPV